jgi:hypothetical protein
MKSLKTISLIFFILLATTNAFSQTDSKDLTITASGSGKTQEEAKQAALRSIIEQAFGAFISTKTEMFNDYVVADQMSSVSSGNIKSYEILNESELPNGKWAVTIKAIVSVDKLASFVEAKGITVEIKGGLFALNIKQQLLNEQAEIQTVAEMVGVLYEPYQKSYDYTIKVGEPKSVDAESINWEIPLEIEVIANKNMDFCSNYCTKILTAISLSDMELENYKNLGKRYFELKIFKDNIEYHFFLRREESLNIFNSHVVRQTYFRSFEVNNGIDTLDFYNSVQPKNPWDKSSEINEKSLYDQSGDSKFSFPASGKQVAIYKFKDNKNLAQLEKLSGYSVKSKGILSDFSHGGLIVWEKNGNGLVVSIMKFGEAKYMSLLLANSRVEAFNINGYSDWRLPTIKDAQAIKEAEDKRRVCCIPNYFWGKEEVGENFFAYHLSFNKVNNNLIGDSKLFEGDEFEVIVVRSIGK